MVNVGPSRESQEPVASALAGIALLGTIASIGEKMMPALLSLIDRAGMWLVAAAMVMGDRPDNTSPYTAARFAGQIRGQITEDWRGKEK